MLDIRITCVIAALLAAAPCGARFRIPEIEQVPAERLISNLEAELDRLQGSFGNSDRIADTRRKLARAHAIAYASGAETFSVRQGTNDLYEYPGRGGILQSLGEPGEPSAETQRHLASAIAAYREIVNADRYDIRSRLGYAWVLEQSGQTIAALDQYRLVAAAAWPLEENAFTSLYSGSMTIFQEAATAILRFLDPERDADEIDELERRLATFDELGRFITPILVPLAAGDTFDSLVDPDAGVSFDLDGSGRARRWGWITPRAAWLVWDPRGEGRIDSGLQLFGSVSFFVFWDNGFEALQMLDDDRDGRLSGAELDGLALWNDADGDGVSDAGEVRSVAAHGVVSIATAFAEHEAGFPFNPAAIGMADGSSRAAYDWIVQSPALSRLLTEWHPRPRASSAPW